MLIEADKLCPDMLTCQIGILTAYALIKKYSYHLTFIIGKVSVEGDALDLFPENVNLVEEEDKGRIDKVSTADHIAEQLKTLQEPVLLGLFQEELIVLAQGHTKDHRDDRIKGADPGTPFRSLTAQVIHGNVQGS